ncbi:MAG TPA: hypothetical protein VIL11_00075 [Limnochordales bacterium]
MRVLVLLAALAGIWQLARWWDRLYPLRQPGRAVQATPDSYLDFALLERGRSRMAAAGSLSAAGQPGRGPLPAAGGDAPAIRRPARPQGA